MINTKYKINYLLVTKPWILLLCSLCYIILLRAGFAECANVVIHPAWVNGDLGICFSESSTGDISKKTQEKVIKHLFFRSIQNKMAIPNVNAMREMWAFLHMPLRKFTIEHESRLLIDSTLRKSLYNITQNLSPNTVYQPGMKLPYEYFSDIIELSKKQLTKDFGGNHFDLRFHVYHVLKDYALVNDMPKQETYIKNLFIKAGMHYKTQTVLELDRRLILHTLSVINIMRDCQNEEEFIKLLINEQIYSKYYNEVANTVVSTKMYKK